MTVIDPGGQPSKQLSEQKDQMAQVAREEPPPSYFSFRRSDPTASGSTPPGVPTSKTKPTNHLSLSTDGPIRGDFVIDPSMVIPPSVLPPVGAGEMENDRKNLLLTSRHSSVFADIWLLGSAIGAHKPRRSTIALTSDNGSIHAQLHVLDAAAPFFLTARASHGTVEIALPRSFHGLLHLTTRHWGTSPSDALVENATQLGQADSTRRYFIGDFRALSRDEWEGDRVEIEVPHGSIQVKYIDEVTEAQCRKGLFARLFGK